MKTEKQITDKLEAIINEVTKAVEPLKSDKVKKADEDTSIKIVTYVSALATIAWVLDCEEELAPLYRAIKIANTVELLKKVK